MTGTVSVEAAARLHFGVLDLRGALGRRFGGIGAAAPAPTLLLSASRADALTVTGEDADRAAVFARQFLGHHGLEGGAHVRVERALPPHAGLGSGTQLGLAVARALAELYDLPTDAPALARAVRRAQRSAIGTWTFAGGGLVLEGGRYPDSGRVAPLLARLPFPRAWRCVIAVPHAPAGMSGAAETEAFAQLPLAPEREVEQVAHMVLMALLPALADGDLARFGLALSEIQSITGRWFAPAQGGTFTPGPTEEMVRRMTEWGAAGVGQSSWGPTVYGIVGSEEAAVELAGRVRGALGSSGTVYQGPFRVEGARVWHAATLLGVP
jgi:beta-ribofuranosylaminobenzene 5'-phosphate synthase